MKNILITGANGQLGNEMRVVAVHSSNQYHYTDVQELDITDEKAVFAFVQEHAIDVVVNCAAYTNVDKAEDDQEMAALLNDKAAAILANACKENKATLIHVSTD